MTCRLVGSVSNMLVTLSDCTLAELLVTALSQEVEDGQVVAVGGPSPILAAAALLARASHAPSITILRLGADGYWPFHGSSKEVLDLGERGLFDVFLLPAPKVDGRGVAVYDADHLSGRFPGGLGTRRLYHLAKRAVLFAETHSRDTFVPRLEPTPDTGPPLLPMSGVAEPYALFTPLCRFDFHENGWRLAALHPGVTTDEVAAATGYSYSQDDPLKTTEWPDATMLRLLRTTIRAQLGERYLDFAAGAFGRGTASGA